jgi:hypothetical protein
LLVRVAHQARHSQPSRESARSSGAIDRASPTDESGERALDCRRRMLSLAKGVRVAYRYDIAGFHV